MAVSLAMTLVLASVPLQPDWAGIIYGWSAASMQTFQA